MAATDHAGHKRPAKGRRSILGESTWAIICGLGLLLLGGASIAYRYGVTLSRRELEEFLVRPDPFDNPEYIRSLCHRVPRVPIGDFRDACVPLARHGDETSVPVLIEALR